MELNERGPALNVFWSRRWRDGRRVGVGARLAKSTSVLIKQLTKKTEPEEQDRRRPVRSFRFEFEGERHQPKTR